MTTFLKFHDGINASNIDKIYWSIVSLYPKDIYILEKNPNKINWSELYKNPGYMCISKNVLTWLSENTSIFTYDYEKMSEHCLKFKEDLMKNRFHPNNLCKFSGWGYEGYDDFVDFE
jgi:hypothetical protein